MSNKDDKLKIVFDPGCFDNFTGSQEELDELMAKLKSMVEDGTFMDNVRPLSADEIDELPDHVLETLEKYHDIGGEDEDEFNSTLNKVKTERKTKLN